MSTTFRLAWAALTLTLTACGAAPKGAAPPEPSPTKASEGPAATTPAPPGGAGAVAKPSVDKPSEGTAAKPTSPTSDVGPNDASATTPPATKRLEDVQTNKATASGGSYVVSVRSAAGLVPDDVGKAVNGAASKTDGCYAKVFKKPGAAGSTSFEVSVGAKGNASGVKMVSDSLKDAETVKCLEGALKAITWPKPTEKAGGKTTIDFTVPTASK